MQLKSPSDAERSFERIYGKPCWDVSPGYGSFLTLEFGEPHLEIREPIVASKKASADVRRDLSRRRVFIHGEWHLWIYCCSWAVFSGLRRVGDSSGKRSIQRAADILDGQKLTGFSIRRNAQCAFEFDLGAILRTRPYDLESEQWMFFQPSGKVLALMADGHFEERDRDEPVER